MKKTGTKKVALYARTATIEESGEKARTQLNNLMQYAAEHGYHIHQVYTDFGFSGLIDKRPALARLLKDAKRKQFETVIVRHPARIARNMALLARILARLERSAVGIEFTAISKTSPVLKRTSLGSFLAGVAEFERGVKSDRVGL